MPTSYSLEEFEKLYNKGGETSTPISTSSVQKTSTQAPLKRSYSIEEFAKLHDKRAVNNAILPAETSTAPVSESTFGTITGPLREGFNGLKTLYGGSENGIARKLASNISEASQDINEGLAKESLAGFGQSMKGVAKGALRTAGDVAGTIFAPVGAVIGATGIGKLFDKVGEDSQKSDFYSKSLGVGAGLIGGPGVGKFVSNVTEGIPNPIDELTKLPVVQEFAVKHPNAAEDFSRALNLIFGKEPGTIEPATVVARTKGQVQSKIIDKAQSLKTSAKESLVNTTATNLKLTPKQIQLEERFAKNTPQFLVDEGVEHLIKADGKLLDTTEAVNALQSKAVAENNAFTSILENDPRYISLDEWGRQAKTKARETFQGSDLESALSKIDNEITSYKIQHKNQDLVNEKGEQLVPSAEMNKIKQYKWERTKGFGSPEAKLAGDLNYQLGNAAKEAIENAYIGDTNISNLNKRLGDFSSAIKILNSRNGAKAGSGAISRTAGRVVGAVVATPLGPMGQIVGSLTGGRLVEILQDPRVSTFVSRTILNKLGRTKDGLSVIAEAEKLVGKRTGEILNNKRLYKPTTINAEGRKSESGIDKARTAETNEYYENLRRQNTKLLPAPEGAKPTGLPTIQLPKKSVSTLDAENNQRNSMIMETNNAMTTPPKIVASNISSNGRTPSEIVKSHLDEIQELLKDPYFKPEIMGSPRTAIRDIKNDIIKSLKEGNFVKEASAVLKIDISKFKKLSDFKKALINALKGADTITGKGLPNREGGFIKTNMKDIPRDLEPLIQEAKKYKSADEFVKAQGEIIYHGTDSTNLNPAEFNVVKAQKGESYFNPLGEGLYGSSNKDFVKRFGKNTEEFILPPTAKVKNISIDTWEKDFPSIAQKSLKNLGIKYDDLTFDEKLLINRLVPNTPIEAANGFEVILRDISERLDKKGSVQGAIQKAVMDKYKDYDVLKYLDTDYAFDANEIVIKNPAILKSKSQLTDIWKKATGKK